MSQLTEAMVTIFTAIIGVALLAVLVSKNAQTGNVLTAFGNMFAISLGAAEAPVTGQAPLTNTFGYPGGNQPTGGGLPTYGQGMFMPSPSVFPFGYGV